MLEELSLVLDEVPSDSPLPVYRSAIIESNVLGKATRTTRYRTARYVTELYALDPKASVFRLLRFFWSLRASGEADLCVSRGVCQRRPLRESTPFILATLHGETVYPTQIAELLRERYPERFRPTTLKSTGQNLASSWTQAGILVEGAPIAAPDPLSPRRWQPTRSFWATWWVYAGSCCWIRPGPSSLIDRWRRSPTWSSKPSRQGWLKYKAAGSVVEISFPGLLTPAEERLSHGSN